MFLKLCKHEIKCTYKTFLIVYGLMLLTAYSICAIMVNGSPYALTWVIMYTVMTIVTIVGTEILVFRAAYLSLFSKTGYLTNTLPVSTTTLFLSKVCVYSLWSILSFFIVLGSVFYIISAIPEFHLILDAMDYVGLVVFAFLFRLILSVVMILFSLAMAQTKYVFSNSLFESVFIFFFLDAGFDFIGKYLPDASFMSHPLLKEFMDEPILNQWATPLGICITIVLIVVLSILTIYIMKHKMELE